MLHQSLPLYEGNQPFIYAFYCAEDDDIAFPVLARMYNEGFRIWSASAGGIANDFRTIQRMNASASIMLFLSKNMLELLRMSDAEAVAAAKNPRLHITVSVDGTKADRSMWALAVPDELEYTPGNDAAFWLYMYTSDKLEKCRGPWPEKKINYRESGFDFFPERAIQDEYKKLENIIRSDGSSEDNDDNKAGAAGETGTVPPPEDIRSRAAYETANPQHLPQYKNNAGYIAPQPDGYVYSPLDRIEAAKTDEEKAFDDFIGYLDRCVEAEERSAAAQEADRKYISGQETEGADGSGETVVNITASAAPDRPYSTPLSPVLTLGEETRQEEDREPAMTDAPELSPRVPENKGPETKADKVITMGDAVTPEDFNPEARRRRMYENGMLDKVLDPNDIDAVIQRRKKEERLKAEEEEKKKELEEIENAAKEAERLLDSIDPPKAEETGKKEEKEIEKEEEQAVPADDKPAKRESASVISEESLENIIDRSDIPGLADVMPSQEQLAAAPTYVIVPPSGGGSIDAPSCLKLIESGAGMIAVPVPEELSALSGDDPSAIRDTVYNERPADAANAGRIDNIISDEGIGYDGTMSGTGDLSEKTEKKRHTIARKIISRRRAGVKVTLVRCEILRSIPQRENDAFHSPGRRSYEENGTTAGAYSGAAANEPADNAEYRSAKSEDNGVTEDIQPASVRKYRNRPLSAAEERALADTDMRGEAYSPYSGPDEMIEEFEPRQSHRKNKHPHSQNGLLANVMAMLSREYSQSAVPPSDTDGSDAGEELYVAERVVSDANAGNKGNTADAAKTVPPAAAGGQRILSLSAAVEKFIEAAPVEPVLVVPRRK